MSNNNAFWYVERRLEPRSFLADQVDLDCTQDELLLGRVPERAVFRHLEGAARPGHVVSTTIPFAFLMSPVARARFNALGLSGLHFSEAVLLGKRMSERYDGYHLAVVRGRVVRLRYAGLEAPIAIPNRKAVRVTGFELRGGTVPSGCDFVTTTYGRPVFVSHPGYSFLVAVAERAFNLVPIAEVELNVFPDELERLRNSQRIQDSESG